ncbi:unnamed protein product [Lymnaea stagnalis]|uniref:Peptidase M20 dimerisation domain-containing protein n=1 Tax=Lymnaea stagnalis TaxID=6523 RepID=A0AAV2IJC0_LYMST
MLKAVILFGVFVLLSVLVSRTVYFSQKSSPVMECKTTDADFIVLSNLRLNRFQTALQFQTISKSAEDYNREALQNFGDFIVKNFPHLHNSSLVELEYVGNYSLLYGVKGSNPQLKPYLLMSHLDVVPATNLEEWDAPPFSGDILNDHIYGRGSIDVKQCVMGILEAVEFLLSTGIQPKRSFYIAFGHDEEVQGNSGAKMISKRLKEKGVHTLEFISDEGLPLTEGIIPGIGKAVARQVSIVGVSEKGQVLLRLSVQDAPGHSSMPPKESTIGILAKAIHKLESNPHPSMLGYGAETAMLEQLAPEMNVIQRFVIANIWLFKPLLSWIMSQKPLTNAMIRTVTAVTIFNAGVKNNIIPPLAEAVVNHRVHPSQTIEEVVEYDRAIIADSRVKIKIESFTDPHPIAGFTDNDFGFQALKTSIRQVWPGSLVVPGIMLANTDTRHYLNFTSNVYRFSPTYMFPGDQNRFHGINERISIKNYEQVINFFYHLIRNSDQTGVTSVHVHHQDL